MLNNLLKRHWATKAFDNKTLDKKMLPNKDVGQKDFEQQSHLAKRRCAISISQNMLGNKYVR